MAYVLSNHFLISSYRRYKISSRPKTPSNKIPLLPHVLPRNMNGTLSFDKSHHLPYRIFRRYQDHHVYMIRHQVTLLNYTLPLFSQMVKYFTQFPNSFLIWPNITFFLYFGMNTTWYLHSHLVWFVLRTSPIVSPACCLAAHALELQSESRICQTTKASPAEMGDLLFLVRMRMANEADFKMKIERMLVSVQSNNSITHAWPGHSLESLGVSFPAACGVVWMDERISS